MPNSSLCSWGSPPPGAAATSVALGAWSRSEATSHTSAAAISTIPAFSHADGVTMPSSTPEGHAAERREQRRRRLARPATCGPARRAGTAASASSASHGRPPRMAPPRAAAASSGTATRARYVEPGRRVGDEADGEDHQHDRGDRNQPPGPAANAAPAARAARIGRGPSTTPACTQSRPASDGMKGRLTC